MQIRCKISFAYRGVLKTSGGAVPHIYCGTLSKKTQQLISIISEFGGLVAPRVAVRGTPRPRVAVRGTPRHFTILSKLLLNIRVSVLARMSARFFRIRGCTPSGHGLLSVLIFSSFFTFSSEICKLESDGWVGSAL